MTEIAASHHPWRSTSKLFLKLRLKKMFEKNSSWVITGTYLVLRYPRKRVKQKIKTYQLIHFYTLNPYLDNVLFLDPSRRLLFSEDKQ